MALYCNLNFVTMISNSEAINRWCKATYTSDKFANHSYLVPHNNSEAINRWCKIE